MCMKKFTKLWRSMLLLAFIWATVSVSGQEVYKNNSRQKAFQANSKEAKVEVVQAKKELEKEMQSKKIAELKAQEKLKKENPQQFEALQALNAQNEEFDLSAYEGLSGKELESKIQELKLDPNLYPNVQKGGDASDLVSIFTFTQSSGTFTPITGGTELGNDTWDDNLYTATPIGFTFNFDGSPFTELTVSANGYLIFGGTSTLGFTPLSSTTAASGCASIMGRDLEASDAVAGSTITYQLTGTSPNQVFTVEWLDAQRYGTNYDGELLDFQIKLYEGTDIIEFVYGPMTGSSYASAVHPQVGLRGASNSDFTVRETTTDWSATVSGVSNSDKCTLTDLIYPADGLTFAFEAPANPPPGAPTSPMPADNETDVAASGDLEWTFGSDTDTYDLFFGETGSMTQVVTGGTAGATGTYTYGPLSDNVEYEWQVVAHNAYGSTNGTVWSFTTACGTFIPPYLEDFTTWTGTPPPDCWSEADAGDPTTGPTTPGSGSWTYDQFGNVGGGSQCAKVNMYFNSKQDWLISPSIDLSAGGLEATFDIALTAWNSTTTINMGSDDQVMFLISTDGGTSWTQLALWDAGSTISNTGEPVTVDLSSYTQTNVLFAFWANEGTADDTEDYDFFVDNFSIDVPPACLEPLNLAITSPTTTGATFEWEPQGTETTWYVEVGLTGFTPGTGTAEESYTKTVSGEPTSTIEQVIVNLDPATEYQAYVQADCGTDAVSDWAGPVTFATSCDVVTVFPWTEDFTDTQICWTVLNENADGDEWDMDYTLNPLSAPEVAVMYTDFNSGSNDDYLISPQLTLPANQELRFWYRVESSGEPNDFEVLLSTTGTDPADFTTTLLANASYSNTTYEEMVISLASYSGDVYIAWRVAPGGLDGWRLYIDDVSIDDLPSCPQPSDLANTLITTTSASLAWTENGSSTSWDIELGVSGFTPTGTPTAAGITNPYAYGTGAEGPLTAATTYDWYVRADCGGDYSAWVGPMTFTTLCNAINTFPYTEGFEDPAFPPICWDNDTWVQSLYGGAHSGTEWAYSNLAGSNLTTPELDLSGDYTLNFWYRAESASYPQDFDVLLSTDGTTFGTTLGTYTGVTTTTYVNEFINLDAYNGQTVWIRFVGLYGTGGFDYGICIDDVTVDLTPACPDPTDLGVANNIGGFIDLMWNSGSGQSNVEWGVSPYTLGTNAAVPATGGVLNIGPLTTGETYDFYVQDDCGSSQSTFAGPFTFTYYPAPANDLCSSPQAVSGPYPVTGIVGTTYGATNDCPAFLDQASGEVWYAIDLPYAHNYIVMDIFGDGLLDNGWIIGTDVQCSCDPADYYYAVDWTFAAPNVTGLTWEDIPGPGTFYYPMATGTVQDGFTMDINVTDGPVVDVSPASFSQTVIENGNAFDHLMVGNTGNYRLDYDAQVVYPGATVTCYPMATNGWTGSTDGSSYTETSLVSAYDTEHGYMMFDISAIPDGATILNIEFNGFVNNNSWPYWAITQVTSNPLTATPLDMYDDIDLGPDYNFNAESGTLANDWYIQDIGGTANTDLEAALTQDWFTIGIRTDDYSTTYFIEFDGWNEANPPFINVTYALGPVGWLTLDGTGGSVGSVAVGDPAVDFLVGFDAATLAPGLYNADIEIATNDPVTPLITVPVSLTVNAGIAAELTVLLEGPYDASGVMLQSLNTSGYIPLAQPYNPALPYYGNAAPAWLYAGTESVTAIPDNVVDWVVVQVRDAADAASASSATIESEQAAFVLTDGSIVGLDGISRLGFPGVTIDNDLFMVVYHRNHLGVMSANALTNVGGFYDYDFSTAETQVYGGANGHKEVEAGYWGMVAADGDANGLIQSTDETGPWVDDLGASGYLGGDFDMNGLGQSTDETGFWAPNLGGGGQVPAKSSDTGYSSQIPK